MALVASEDRLVVSVPSASAALAVSVARLVLSVLSALVRLVISVARAFEPDVVLASTYVFTAFCVGYNSSLAPRVMDVDLLLRSSLVFSISCVREVTAAATKEVVAIWEVLAPAAAVGAEGVPVKAGETLITTLPLPVTGLETTFLPASVKRACEAAAPESIGAEAKVVTPEMVRFPTTEALPERASAPFSEVLPEKVLFPATVWSVVRSTKFLVDEPVPPLARGRTPVTREFRSTPE